MKNKALFAFIFFIAISRFGYSQITVIPDPNFEQALIDLGYDDVIDGQAQTATLASIGTLDVSNKGINDLTGIESFYILFSLDVKDNSLTTLNLVNNVGLNFLDCRNNTLTELDLSQNLFITDLNCSLNELTSLSLAGNTVIETLNCSNNQLTTLDISDAGLLIDLNCSVNELSSLDITNSFGIEKINCSGNNLETYNFSNNTNLRNLSIQFNPTTELDVTNNTLLNTLYCNNNWALLGSINLENNALLTTFSSSNTSLDCIQVANANDALDGVGIYATWSKDIATLYSTDCAGIEKTLIPDSNFEQALIDLNIDSDGEINGMITAQDAVDVGDLDVSSRNISSLSGLEYFENLNTLNCSNNPITKLDLDFYIRIPLKYYTYEFESYQELVNLNCNNTSVSSLYFYSLDGLKNINISSNPLLEAVDLEHIPELSTLDLRDNNILERVNIDFTGLTILNLLENCPSLKRLSSYSTPIETLDISENLLLESLLFYECNLSELDLTQHKSLKSIGLEDNKLTFLDVRNGNNSALTSFNVTINPNLECILVDDATTVNAGQTPYANWMKDDNAAYRTESCDYDVVLSTDEIQLMENGEQATITATLNEVNPTEDVTLNLKISGSANHTNYTLSSNSIIIPFGQLSATATLTANEDDMDSDKTVIIDVESVENADVLTNQQLIFTIIHINSAPTDITLSTLAVDENSEVGTEIGFFTTTDIDSEDSFTYTLVSGEGDHDNSSFSINDNLLISREVFDFETKNSFSIRVLSDDGNGGVFSKSFTISVNDTNFIVVEDSIASLSFKNNIYIKLESSVITKGFQFDIDLPDGFEFNSTEITNIGLPENFQISSENISGNTFRVLGYSLSNETIDSGASLIIALPTFIDESTTIGEYPIPVYNVSISDVDNQDIASLSQKDGVVTVYKNPRGDANGDNMVNVIDILSTIDYIFGNPPSVFNFDLVDINSDNTINVLDVLGIQDIILNRTGKSTSGKNGASVAKILAGANYLVVNSKSFSAGTSETIEINLENEDVVKGLQFDFVLPDGFTLNTADVVGSSRVDGFNINTQEVSANTYRVIVFSLNSSTIASGTGVAFNVPVVIDPDISVETHPIEFTGVVISDTNNTDVSTVPTSIGEISIVALGLNNFENYENSIKLHPNPVNDILNLNSEFKGDYLLFDLNGRNVGKGDILLGENKVNTSLLQSGLYIIKINNDKGALIKKIMKK